MESLVMKEESERIEVESNGTNKESSDTIVESIIPSSSILSARKGDSLITDSVLFSNVVKRLERLSEFIFSEFENEGSTFSTDALSFISESYFSETILKQVSNNISLFTWELNVVLNPRLTPA